MGKKIAVYLDGTWNTPEDRTNVFTLFEETVGDIAGPDILKPPTHFLKKPFAAIINFVRSDYIFTQQTHQWLKQRYINFRNSPQVRYYDQGVGTHLMNLFRGGATGRGVNRNVQQAYEFLCYCYEPGDEIYVFGFSRGAYTARSLVGVLSRIGLLTPEECCNISQRKDAMDHMNAHIKYANNKRMLEEARQQQKKSPKPMPEPKKPEWLASRGNIEPSVKFLGVWDTVGAMGIPKRYKGLLRFLPKYQSFPNTEICSNVENAYHAMAIDEHRTDFKPTPWTYPHDSTKLPERLIEVEQLWFPGAHANVGGGYKDNYLNEIPCHWLQQKAMQHGLVFHRELTPSSRCIKEPVKDSFKEFAIGIHKLFNRPVLREITAGLRKKPGSIVCEGFHDSVWDYATENIYRPRNLPAREIDKHLNRVKKARVGKGLTPWQKKREALKQRPRR